MKIIDLKVKDLKRHPIHEKLNLERTEKELESHAESILKHGRQNPLIYQSIELDGKQVPHIIDGWSTVQVALLKGIEKLPAIELAICTKEELPELIMEVQSSFHRDPAEDYKRFEFFFEIISNGRGHRSDLNNDKN
jgi:hypothetical protein